MLSLPSAQLAPLTHVYPRTRDFKSAIDNGYAALSDESIDNSYLSFSGVTPQLFESIKSRRDDTLNSSHVFTPKIQNPSTPSPSPSSQQEAIGVVIPSPSRQLKKQVEQSEWVKPPPFTPEKTVLSTEYYPIDAHEKRALKGAYPSARKIKRSEMSQTRPLHFAVWANHAGLTEQLEGACAAPDKLQQLHANFDSLPLPREIHGPECTVYAIQHRIKKLRQDAWAVAATDGDSSIPATPEKRNRGRGKKDTSHAAREKDKASPKKAKTEENGSADVNA